MSPEPSLQSTDQVVTPAPAPAPAPAPVVDKAPADPAPVVDNVPADPAPVVEKASAGAKDWATRRVEYAKGDEKLLKRLSRYSSEEAVVDALIAAQNKIASGGLKAPLSEKATPEEVKAWREDNGIPAEPTGYEVSIPDTVALDETGEKVVNELLTVAHNNNMQPAQVQAMVDYLFEQRQRQEEAVAEADEAARSAAEESLRAEMGSEYKLNINLINNLLDTAPEGIKDEILMARQGDGTPLASNPLIIRWLANMARELNPVATVLPNSGTGGEKAIEDEVNSLKTMMGDPESAYWKGPSAAKNQARYRELVSVQSKLKSR